MPTLNWIGKDAVINHHLEVPFRLLKDVPELGCGDPGCGNLIVEGDNLVALKALLPYYKGKVKCICIDPPYNTGNEGWAYNDNVNSPAIRKWLGETVGKEGETLDRHDRWLCMMYPRLALLREFLSEDGCIFVFIDDHELNNLIGLLDEVFVGSNHLATLVWEKGKKGDSKFFSESHEYIPVYAKNKAHLLNLGVKWKRRKDGVDQVIKKYNGLRDEHGSQHELIRRDLMAWFRSLPSNDPAKAHKHYNWSDERGLYFPDNFHGPDDGRESRPRYDIIHPITKLPCAKPSTGWRWEEARTISALSENPPRIHFGPDETTIPCRKTYLLEATQEPFPTVFYKDGRSATLMVESILGKGAFAFPKDVQVIADLIGMVTEPGDIVLDSFAGSGTTGHSTLQINHRSTDKVGRRFVLVQQPFENCKQAAGDENLCRDKTAKRIQRVAEGYTNAKGEEVPGLGGGFRYVRLGDELFDEHGRINEPTVRFADLARHVYFSETGEPLPKERISAKSPWLGIHHGRAVYLLYNGILKDKSVDGGNVLTTETLAHLPAHDGPKVVYAAGCRFSKARLAREGLTFKQTPYAIRTR